MSASASTFHMFVEEMRVFFELELMLLLISLYSVVLHADSLICYHFVEFGWFARLLAMKFVFLKANGLNVLRSATVAMFVEELLVFCEMKLIVPLQEFFYAYSPICFYFVEFGWIRSATNHEICVLKDK